MKLKPLDDTETLALVAGWLTEKENARWLDFGDGRRTVTPASLKIMTQTGRHVLRVFTANDTDVPIGVVGLSNVDRECKTGWVWVVLGDKSYARKGYATRAVSEMLSLAFRGLGLLAVGTWVVAHNPSIGVVENLPFRSVGRLRQCHSIDGQPYDRLLFDMLAAEYEES